MKESRTGSGGPDDPDAIARWCRTVLRALADRGQIKEPLLSQMLGVIERVVRSGDRMGLRSVRRDLDQVMRNLDPDDRTHVQAMLSQEGANVAGPDPDELGRIMKRGLIKTDDEYQLVMRRIDEIFQDPEKQGELAELNEILLRSGSR
jgi:hypothetical protein